MQFTEQRVERMMRNKDPRVQAIRCTSCHRLRAHPDGTELGYTCHCGGVGFVPTFPHPDEEEIAIKLYAKEIEERNLWAHAVQEFVAEWEAGKSL